MQVAELLRVAGDGRVPNAVTMRATMVLWRSEGKTRVEIADLAQVSLPTVDRWIGRYLGDGVAGLVEKKPGGWAGAGARACQGAGDRGDQDVAADRDGAVALVGSPVVDVAEIP